MCVLAIANIMATDSNGKPSCNGSVGGLMCSVYKTNINTPPTHPLQVQSFLWNFSSGSFVCSHFLTSSDPVSLWKVHIIDICIGDSCIVDICTLDTSIMNTSIIDLYHKYVHHRWTRGWTWKYWWSHGLSRRRNWEVGTRDFPILPQVNSDRKRVGGW